jgi:ketosteroid isomerase-like protein
VNDPADVQAVKDTAPAYDKFANAGDTAVVHGLWTEKSTLNGKDTSGQYRFTDTFIKRDGRWQAVATFSTKLK